MLKKGYWLIAAILIIIVGILLFYQFENKEDSKNQEEDITIGVIMNGNVDDRGWNQSHYEAFEKVKSDTVHIIYKENVPETELCSQYMEEMIKDGADIIIADSFGFGDFVLAVAKQYPEIKFYHATGITQSDNVATYFGRIYQMRYLSGLVAGMQTKTNEIGYVAAFNIPEVVRGINAFTLGVRAANGEANVNVIWTDSWGDETIAREATEKLIDDYQVDVVTQHCDTPVPLEAAEERGIYSIGYNLDNTENYPNSFLTAPVWRWDVFYSQIIESYKVDKFKSINYWEGIESGIVDLAPLSDNVVKEAKELVDYDFSRMKDGSWDVFYGPIADNEGKIRVRTNENISDEVLLNELDWFVEGVIER